MQRIGLGIKSRFLTFLGFSIFFFSFFFCVNKKICLFVCERFFLFYMSLHAYSFSSFFFFFFLCSHIWRSLGHFFCLSILRLLFFFPFITSFFAGIIFSRCNSFSFFFLLSEDAPRSSWSRHQCKITYTYTSIYIYIYIYIPTSMLIIVPQAYFTAPAN